MSTISENIPSSREVTLPEQRELSKRNQSEEIPEIKFDKFLEEELRVKNSLQSKEGLVGHKRQKNALVHKKNVSAQDESRSTRSSPSKKKKEVSVAAPLEARFHSSSRFIKKNTPLTQQGQAELLKKGGGEQKQPLSVKEAGQKPSPFDSFEQPEKNSFRVGFTEKPFGNRAEISSPELEFSSEKDFSSLTSGNMKDEGNNLYSARFKEEGKEQSPLPSRTKPKSPEKVYYINLDGKMHRVGFEGASDQSLRPTGVVPLKNHTAEQSGLTFRVDQDFSQPFDPLPLVSTTSHKVNSLPPKTALKEKSDVLVTGKGQTSSSSESARLTKDQSPLRNTFQDSSGRLFENEEGLSDNLDISVGSKGQDVSSLRNNSFTKAPHPKSLPGSMGAGTLESPKFVAVNVSPPSLQKSGSLSLRLMPEVLGRLEVNVRLTRDGRLDAVVKAEKSETFETFQRDSATLKQVIAEAFGADLSDMGFTLLDDSGTQPRTPHHDLENQYAMKQEKDPLSEDGTDLAKKTLTNLIDQSRALDALV